MTRKRLARTAAAALLTLAAAGLLARTGLVQPDWYPQAATYGVSAGTDTAYCSADLVHWVPQVSCERAS